MIGKVVGDPVEKSFWALIMVHFTSKEPNFLTLKNQFALKKLSPAATSEDTAMLQKANWTK